MKKIKIFIDEKSLEKHHETITGIIYLEFEGFFFPEKKWNDFIIIMINNWIRSMRNIVLKTSEYAELLFIDGSFFIRVTMIDDKKCFIECIENYQTENILFEEQIEFKSLMREVISIANLCNVFCKERNWQTEELDILDNLLQKISIK